LVPFVVDADDAAVVGVGYVDAAGGVEGDSIGSIEVADAAAAGTIGDLVGAVDVVGAEDLFGVGVVEGRVGGVIGGVAAA